MPAAISPDPIQSPSNDSIYTPNYFPADPLLLSPQRVVKRFDIHILVDGMLTPEVMEYAGLIYSNIPEEDESAIIYASELIEPDNEAKMMEFFVGWAMTRIERYRRFIVIFPDKPDDTYKKR